MVAVLNRAEVGVGSDAISVGGLVEVSQQRDVAPERSDHVSRRDEARGHLTLEADRDLMKHRALTIALRRPQKKRAVVDVRHVEIVRWKPVSENERRCGRSGGRGDADVSWQFLFR